MKRCNKSCKLTKKGEWHTFVGRNWKYDCHRFRARIRLLPEIHSPVHDPSSIYRRKRDARCNLPRARTKRSCLRARELTMQRDSLSKSLPEIIRKERFALLIEIKIINKCAASRHRHRVERWKGPIISPETRKTTRRRARVCTNALLSKLPVKRSSSIFLREIKFKSCGKANIKWLFSKVPSCYHRLHI